MSALALPFVPGLLETALTILRPDERVERLFRRRRLDLDRPEHPEPPRNDKKH